MAPTLDVEAIRAESPALVVEQDGRPVAYFDGPGGTQVHQRVIDAMADYRTANANDGGPLLTGTLGEQGIFTWDGHFCAQALVERRDLADKKGGLPRLDIVHYNTAEEVDRLLEAIETLTEGRPAPGGRAVRHLPPLGGEWQAAHAALSS